MRNRILVLVFIAALTAVGPLAAEDLMQIYREALRQDPTLASARSTWLSTQEQLPIAQAGLLPSLNLGSSINFSYFRADVDGTPAFTRNFNNYGMVLSFNQPLYRRQNRIVVEQARSTIGQSDYVLAQSQQDLIIRVAQAYFDILLGQVQIELSESQRAAVSEQLAQAKRNFEVGTATIVDTNEAQARYDQIIAQEITARNDLENRIAALRSFIGRFPRDIKPMTRRFMPRLPEPNILEPWFERAAVANYQVRISQAAYDFAVLEVDRARAASYPTVDAVASYNHSQQSGTTTQGFGTGLRQGVIGLSFAMPLFQGGAIEARVRQALANQETARQGLETARRNASLLSQTAFSGVNNGEAQIRALEQALVSAQSAYDSNKLGQEVGVRTTLDVLNQQQQLYIIRRDLAKAYYDYIINALRLKAAVGELREGDLELANRELG